MGGTDSMGRREGWFYTQLPQIPPPAPLPPARFRGYNSCRSGLTPALALFPVAAGSPFVPRIKKSWSAPVDVFVRYPFRFCRRYTAGF